MGKFKVGDKVRLNDKKLSALMKKYQHTWYYIFKKEQKGKDVFTIKDIDPCAFYIMLEEDDFLIFKEEWLEAVEESEK